MGKRQNILLERVSIMANKKMKTAVKSVKKQRTKKALKRTKVQSMENKKGVLFSIRAKIFLCFLVPILFLILVGVFSYKKAAAGMYDTFRDSNEQTINMANQYLDGVLGAVKMHRSVCTDSEGLSGTACGCAGRPDAGDCRFFTVVFAAPFAVLSFYRGERDGGPLLWNRRWDFKTFFAVCEGGRSVRAGR